MLNRYHHLLVPLNFSNSNKIALETALDIASSASAKVTLLHVIEPINISGDCEVQDFTEKLRSRADEKLLKQAQRFIKRDITVACKNLVGNRVKEIIKFAGDNSVDLIVLNTRRMRDGQSTKALASLSYQVTFLASCPVFLLK